MPTYLWDSTLACRARAEASPLAVARPSIGCACSTFKVAQPARRKPVECVSGGGIAQVSANWAARRSRGFASVADRDGYLLTLLLRLEVWRWRSRFASVVMPPRPPASHLPCMCRSEKTPLDCASRSCGCGNKNYGRLVMPAGAVAGEVCSICGSGVNCCQPKLSVYRLS